MFQRVMITFFPLLVLRLGFKIEVPKIKKIEISENGLLISDPIFGQTTSLVWKDLNEYQTVVHFTRDGLLRELMLISENKVIHEVSENYSQVKRAITKNLYNLGSIDFSYFEYIKKRLFR